MLWSLNSFIDCCAKMNRLYEMMNKEKTMYFLKMILIRVSVLRAIDYFENVDDIILTVNVSNAEWKVVLMQKHKDKKHSNKYENDLWANVERKYDSKKRKCRKLLKILKKIRFWLYEIHFVVKINVNTFVTQLNQSIVDLSKVFVTRWLTWIRFFDFDVRHVSDKKHEIVDEFSRRFRIVSNNIDEINEIDIDNFIDVEMNCV